MPAALHTISYFGLWAFLRLFRAAIFICSFCEILNDSFSIENEQRLLT